VELLDDGMKVRLVDTVYKPVKDSEKTAIEAGSLAINRLGKSVIHNTSRVAESDAPWLQQDRWSTRIPADRLEEVRKSVRAVLEKHILEVENCMEDEEKKPSESPECSVGVGWYYWESSPEQASS
jgi:hypothetical protein